MPTLERVSAPAVAVALSLTTGATDAFAFQALGGIFTANMTGNLILTALFERPGYGETLAGAVLAITVFAAALAVGFRATRAVALLGAATALQALVLVGWVRGGPGAGLGLRYALIACSAAAIALQTVAARGLSSLAGITTTYVTGTLTSLVGDRDGHFGLRLAVLLAIPAGAVLGAVVYALDPLLGTVPAFTASAVALGLFITRKEAS